jgi:hypothetical protein
VKVGDTVWFFDINSRVYTNAQSAPIWRKHWRKATIVSETTRSWVTDRLPTKLPKKGPWPRGWVATEAEIDRLEWIEANARALARKVERLESYELLKQIEALLL